MRRQSICYGSLGIEIDKTSGRRGRTHSCGAEKRGSISTNVIQGCNLRGILYQRLFRSTLMSPFPHPDYFDDVWDFDEVVPGFADSFYDCVIIFEHPV